MPPTQTDVLVSLVKDVQKSEFVQGIWCKFNEGVPRYLNPARHTYDSLLNFLVTLSNITPPVGDPVAYSCLMEAAQGVSSLVRSQAQSPARPGAQEQWQAQAQAQAQGQWAGAQEQWQAQAHASSAGMALPPPPPPPPPGRRDGFGVAGAGTMPAPFGGANATPLGGGVLPEGF